MTRKRQPKEKKVPKTKLGQVIARRILTEYTGEMIRNGCSLDWSAPPTSEGRLGVPF